MPSKLAIERSIERLLKARSGKTICPSEVARELDPEGFRALMPSVREVAAQLRARGRIMVTQRGKPVDPLSAHGPVRLALPNYRGVDFRRNPQAYHVGRGERGVLSAEPYKSELLPLWRFRTPAIARESSQALWKAFVAYRKARDMIGMDMARKFLQMGFTRSRRYANHASGRKYEADGSLRDRESNPEKAECAAIFRALWQRAEADPVYRAWRAEQRSSSAETARRPRKSVNKGT